MKKNRLFFLLTLLTMLLLAACNTAEEPTITEPASDSVTTNEVENDSVNEDEIVETGDQKENPVEDGNVTEDEPSTTPKETMTKINGDNYSMEAFDGFTFTPEEPGKDVLMYDDNDAIWMRIEAISKNDTTLDDLVANTEEWMAAVHEGYKTNNIDALVNEHKNIQNAVSYVANVEAEKVTTVVFEKGNLLVRLTIFDSNDVNLTEEFIKMGFTIEEK